MRLTDIHAHLADPRILPRIDAILDEARRHGVVGVLATAARLGEWPPIAALATRPGVHGALGLHPFFLDEWRDDLPCELRKALLAQPRCRAVGEIGLDFGAGRADTERQIAVLTAQLEVARDLDLPVILHNRKAWEPFFATLKALGIGTLRGVCHHFSSSVQVARRALDHGLDISFCGPLTYPNARRIKAVAAYVPLERILTETDAPDLAAFDRRGGPSLPHHVADIVVELARIKGLAAEQVAAQVEANFRRLLRV